MAVWAWNNPKVGSDVVQIIQPHLSIYLATYVLHINSTTDLQPHPLPACMPACLPASPGDSSWPGATVGAV